MEKVKRKYDDREFAKQCQNKVYLLKIVDHLADSEKEHLIKMFSVRDYEDMIDYVKNNPINQTYYRDDGKFYPQYKWSISELKNNK